MDYYKVNGYSNEYWGWGYEDDDLLFRCKENLFDFNTKQTPIKTINSAGLEFNGWDSEVKIPMKFGLDNYTILLSPKTFFVAKNIFERRDISFHDEKIRMNKFDLESSY